MEKAFVCLSIIILLFFYLVVASVAMTLTNITTDQSALLSLKSQIISDPFNLLDGSWSPTTSVCHWAGVTCGTRHERVKSLNISNMALTGIIPPEFGNLTFLVSLDMSSNNFYGNLPQEMARLRRLKFVSLSFNNFSGEVPYCFGALHQLQVLTLTNNSFSGSIPSSLSNISTLQTLDFKFNSLEGQIPEEIGNLKNLRFLILWGNNLKGYIPPSLVNASMLETLHLSYNFLHGNIPEEIGNLQNLKSLSFEHNNLTGSIPFSIFNISGIEVIAFSKNTLSGNLPTDVCDRLPMLEKLLLSVNELYGHMPLSLTNCSKLQYLSISMNEFDGPICSEFGRLSNLKSLYLGHNHFEGTIPQDIGTLDNLLSLGLENNQITGRIPTSIFNISSLQLLSLSYNNLTGSLSGEIGNLTKLQILYLSNNMVTGEIPKDIGNLMELVELGLELNKFTGSFPMEIFNISGIRVIELNGNDLPGTLPLNIGSMLPNIEALYLSAINLFGTIPHSLSNCSKLTILEISKNRLTGLIPNSLGYLTHLQHLSFAKNNLKGDNRLSFLTSLSNCRDLEALFVSSNPLNGELPAFSVGNLSTSLARFEAVDCGIKGEIPKGIRNLSSLIELELSQNSLIGSIPGTTISNLRFLQHFNLSDNKLSGFIGDDLCKLQNLAYLNLAQNRLSGSLPNCLGNITSLVELNLGSNKLHSNIPASFKNLQNLLKLDLSSNNLGGSLPPEIGNLKAVIYMDLSMNKFSNGIPREIGGLQNLIHLSLKDNKLQGSMHESMSSMTALEFLDLSHNNLTGLIPKSLEKLIYLKYFNVSFNKLVGEIPSGGPFKNLSSQSFMSNEALCGSPRFRVPPCDTTTSKYISKRRRVLTLFLLAGVALAVLVPLAFALVWIKCIRGKRTDPKQAADSSSGASTRGRISYYELLQATDSLSESNLIGSGSFGSVYKGILRDGTPIAVKVFNLQMEAAFRSFDTECKVLCNLRHRNLTKVITSCSNLDFKALVLEFMPNGSLDKWLYSHNYFLDIKHRLSIMIDVACALEYLHYGFSALPVIHCDLKPSNVLLDEDMVAHLSDFGISKMISTDESASYTKTLATFGYIAPEYGLEGLVSTKSDVYSYGIMLMETFTRTKPADEMFDEDLDLKQWVSNSIPHAVMKVVDANLVTPHDNHLKQKLNCLVSIMEVAIDCCSESPRERIDMKNVVGRLKTIQRQLLAC